MWQPCALSNTLETSVVEDHLGGLDNLQSYFAAPWSKEMDAELCQTSGSCTTVTILIVVMCLRFKCEDPQLMVDIIRCIMRHLHHTRKGKFVRFLFQIRQWQNHLSGENLSDKDFEYWLGITCKSGTQLCNCVIQDTKGKKSLTLCQNLCAKGTVWCSEHIVKKTPATKLWMDRDQYAQGTFIP